MGEEAQDEGRLTYPSLTQLRMADPASVRRLAAWLGLRVLPHEDAALWVELHIHQEGP